MTARKFLKPRRDIMRDGGVPGIKALDKRDITLQGIDDIDGRPSDLTQTLSKAGRVMETSGLWRD